MRHKTCSCLLCYIFSSLFQNCFQAQPFATQLLNNTQGAAGIPGVRVAPGRSALEQNLAEIVIHTTAVLQCINQMTVCEPLRLLMDNPAALMVRLRKLPVLRYCLDFNKMHYRNGNGKAIKHGK